MGELLPNGKRFVSMRMKFMVVMLITGTAVLMLALSAIPVSLQIFHKYHTRPEQVEARLENYVREFAAYVAEEKITSDDAEAVVEWTRRHRSVYLTVFNGSDDHFGAAGGELWEGEEKPDMDPFFDKLISSEGSVSSSSGTDSNMYIVLFANGIHSVAVVDYSLSTGSDTIIILGVLISVLIFFTVLLVYYRKQARAIVTLSRMVETVSDGDLTASGYFEIRC